jgi:hypothetical protein
MFQFRKKTFNVKYKVSKTGNKSTNQELFL